MTVNHIVDTYEHVLQLEEEAKKIYKAIKQHYISEQYIIVEDGYLRYKLKIMLLKNVRL